MDNYGTPEEMRERVARLRDAPDEFEGPIVPVQVKLPQDLLQSLKLHAIQHGKTQSQMVLECLTTETKITKAWIATRRAG